MKSPPEQREDDRGPRQARGLHRGHRRALTLPSLSTPTGVGHLRDPVSGRSGDQRPFVCTADCLDEDGPHPVRGEHHLLPGEPQHDPSSGDQLVVAPAVVPQLLAGPVEGEAVGLDDDPQPDVGQVDSREERSSATSTCGVDAQVRARPGRSPAAPTRTGWPPSADPCRATRRTRARPPRGMGVGGAAQLGRRDVAGAQGRVGNGQRSRRRAAWTRSRPRFVGARSPSTAGRDVVAQRQLEADEVLEHRGDPRAPRGEVERRARRRRRSRSRPTAGRTAGTAAWPAWSCRRRSGRRWPATSRPEWSGRSRSSTGRAARDRRT